MIRLHTHVLSEAMRPQPSEAVMAWLDRQAPEPVRMCAISRAEIALASALMPAGKRQAASAPAAATMFTQDFAGRCLPFDKQAALHHAAIAAQHARTGRPIGTEDAQIASIARLHGLMLATRNGADGDEIDDSAMVNPWHAED